ncbi:SLBP-RNA-bind domain-containing protein [Aphelenchoides bicaudatus]|nr:SLBP-RNA-bind domain-containing protein [Aphelenchoides bicaudatus]
MASPRKQRKLDDGTPATPQKSDEKSSTSKLVFTPIQSFDWAELSAKEHELRVSGTPTKAEEDEIDAEEDGEFPPLNSSQNSKCPDSGGPANRTRSRKKPTPKRADTTNKFEKNLDLTAALKFARSERVKKLEADKRRIESGSTPTRHSLDDGQRKRRRSPSVSTVASITPGRRPQPKKVQRMDSSVSSGSTPSRRSQKSMTPNDTMSPRPAEHYVEPKVGWCQDEVIIRRRAVQIEQIKARDIYKRYQNEVNKPNRLPTDPRTPNKYLKHSSRGWDGQYRKWKKSLYVWAGEEYTPSEVSSRAASRAESRASESDNLLDFNENDEGERKGKLKPKTLQFSLENPDNVASLMGHFDLNTRQATLLNDESTLKANENRGSNAPTDFSQLHS